MTITELANWLLPPVLIFFSIVFAGKAGRYFVWKSMTDGHARLKAGQRFAEYLAGAIILAVAGFLEACR